MDFLSSEIDPSHWKYRIEGARHLVFSYNGPSPLHRLQNTILRLDAGPSPSSAPGAPTPSPLASPGENHAFVCAVFAAQGAPLGPYVDPGYLADVSKGFRDALLASALVQHLRPSRRRRARPRLDVAPSTASHRAQLLVQPDCARLFTTPASTTACVEIKPKAALTSVSRLVPPHVCDALGKFELTPYALKNATVTRCCKQSRANRSDGGAFRWSASVENEGNDGDDARKPLYCADDLLSGERWRVHRAMEALRTQRAHSLRVFHDGAVGLADDLPIDTRLFGNRDEAYEAPENISAIEAAARVLADAPGLADGIYHAQKRDYIDALGAEKIYDHLVSKCCGGDIALADDLVWEAYFAETGVHSGAGRMGSRGEDVEEALAEARARISYRNSGEAMALHDTQAMLAAEKAVAAMSPHVAARVLADFMIARVVTDCSIMVSMTRRAPAYKLGPGERAVKLADGSICLYELHVVDLEPKPLSKLPAWANRDRASVAKCIAASSSSVSPSSPPATTSSCASPQANAAPVHSLASESSMFEESDGSTVHGNKVLEPEGPQELPPSQSPSVCVPRQRSASCQPSPCSGDTVSIVSSVAVRQRSASQPRQSALLMPKSPQQRIVCVDSASCAV